MTVDEFAIDFYVRLDKIAKLDRLEKIKGHLLLCESNFDSHH